MKKNKEFFCASSKSRRNFLQYRGFIVTLHLKSIIKEIVYETNLYYLYDAPRERSCVVILRLSVGICQFY